MADNPKSSTVTSAAMLVAALFALGGFGYIFSIWWSNSVSDPEAILRIATDQYIAGEPIIAGDLAAKVHFDTDTDQVTQQPPIEETEQEAPEVPLTEEEIAAKEAAKQRNLDWVSVRDFLVGAGKYSQALQADDLRSRRALYRDALDPLIASRRHGFPPGRRAEGDRMLGDTLFQLAKYEQAAETLRRALKLDPTLQRTLLPKIAESEMRIGDRDSGNAMTTIENYLSNPNLKTIERWQGERIRLRAFLKDRNYRELQAIADKLRSMPVEADLQMEAKQVEFLREVELVTDIAIVQQAIDSFGNVPKDPAEDRSTAIEFLSPTIQSLSRLQREAKPSTASEAQLWNARALLCTGDTDAGLSLLTALRQQRPFQGNPLLGGIEEVELLASEGRGTEMLQTLRYMVRELRDSNGLDVRKISFDDFKRRFIGAVGMLRDRGDFLNAIDASRSFPPVFDQATALTQEGITFREWAIATLDDGKDASGELTRSASIDARTRFRAAGDAFHQAAMLQFDTPEYVPALWAAIEAYQRGRHFRRSLDLLESYQHYEDRQPLPRGLVAYGRALLAEGDVDRALEKFEECMVEHPRDPFRYDARLLAAQGMIEKQEFDEAQRYLIQNLQDGELTPQSPAWRDSLFTLGEMLYEKSYQTYLTAQLSKPDQKRELMRGNQKDLQDAVRYLDQAVERYWPLPRAESAAYLSARAHVLSSQWPRLESQSPELLEAARRTLRTKADQELNIALDGFARVKQHLLGREEEVRLPAKEQRILRNCFIAEAETLKEMSRLEDAVSAFRAIELRYLNEPLALEAILGRADCARGLGRKNEANLLVQQAGVVLKRIPEDWNGRFAEMTRFDRQGWEQYLEWMTNRLPQTLASENS